MEWIKIDKDKIKKGNFLCANFDRNSIYYKEKLYGEICRWWEDGSPVLNFSFGVVPVTHYLDIDINKFDL